MKRAQESVRTIENAVGRADVKLFEEQATAGYRKFQQEHGLSAGVKDYTRRECQRQLKELTKLLERANPEVLRMRRDF
jgi:hypothetical protein